MTKFMKRIALILLSLLTRAIIVVAFFTIFFVFTEVQADMKYKCTSPSPPPSKTMAKSVLLIIGGNFSPDHIGPEEYDRYTRDVRTHPIEYLNGLEHFLRSATDEELSDVYPYVILNIIKKSSDRRFREVSHCARMRYKIAISRVKKRNIIQADNEDVRRVQRLESTFNQVQH